MHTFLSLGVSKEETFESFSSTSSFDDIVPVDDVRAILLMSPTEKEVVVNAKECHHKIRYYNKLIGLVYFNHKHKISIYAYKLYPCW